MAYCLLVILALLANFNSVHGGYHRICYYTNWSQYRTSGVAKFLPKDIDPSLCTHIVYAFAKIGNGNSLEPYEWNDESQPWSVGMYEKVIGMKEQNPSLKILLAVGGWTFGSAGFTRMVRTEDTRRRFITTSINFLRKRGFDGLDIDWEYPADRGSPPQDKFRFTSLIQEMRAAFNSELLAGKERLLLTVAVSAGESKINNGYEIAKLARELDWVGLLSYDLHGSWESKVGHHSALYSHDTSRNNEKLTVIWAAEKWLGAGTPRDKLVIGLPTYGRSFQLRSSAATSLGSAANGAGPAGQHTREAGFLAYYEICQLISSGGTSVESTSVSAPYAYKGRQWVGYHNRNSFKTILDYIKSEGLAGAMVWSLDLDDFTGRACGQGKYPLINTIKRELTNGQAPVAPVQPPVVPVQPPVVPVQPPVVPVQPPVVPVQPPVVPVQPPVVPVQPPVVPVQPPVIPVPIPNPVVPNSGGYKRVCYFTNWSQYRYGVGKFTPSDIDPFLCTHIVYAFAELNDNLELVQTESNDVSTQGSKGLYEQVMDLRNINPQLSVSLAVGGWDFGTDKFSRMAASFSTRQRFINNAIAFLRFHGFDGLNLDWEYPSGIDKYRFTTLVKELRVAFNFEIRPTSWKQLLLTAAVPAGEQHITAGYEINKLASLLDWVNLMAYDFYGSWGHYTGHHSALYSHDPARQSKLTIAWAVQKWLIGGMPRSKLVVGMPTYGRTFRLASTIVTALGSLSFGVGQEGPYTNAPGILAYYEVCGLLNSGWNKVTNTIVKAPYAYKDLQWVGYHNPESFDVIAQWIKSQGLAGAMVWNLDFDDFTGEACGQGKYPLINTIKRVFTSTSGQPQQPPPQQPPPQQPPPQQPPPQQPPPQQPPPQQPPPQQPPPQQPPPQQPAPQQPPPQQPLPQQPPPQQPPPQQPPPQQPPPQQPPPQQTTTPQPTATQDFICPFSPGYFVNPADCGSFFICVQQQPNPRPCPSGTGFNGRVCDWKRNIPACQNQI